MQHSGLREALRPELLRARWAAKSNPPRVAMNHKCEYGRLLSYCPGARFQSPPKKFKVELFPPAARHPKTFKFDLSAPAKNTKLIFFRSGLGAPRSSTLNAVLGDNPGTVGQ